MRDDPRSASAHVADDYRARGASFAAARDRHLASARRISWLRLAVFLIAGVALWRLTESDANDNAWAIAFAALSVAFVALVAVHRRVRARASAEDARRRECELGVHRVTRAWAALPVPALRPPADHAYAYDLDIAGRGSLAQLLDVVTPAPGWRTLGRWLLEPADDAHIVVARQEAVAELRPMSEWRETLAAHARTAGTAPAESLERFLEWTRGEMWLRSRPALLWGTRLFPLLSIAVIAAAAAGRLPSWAWMVPVALGGIVTAAANARLKGALNAALGRATGFASHAAMLAHVEGSTFVSTLLRDVRGRVGEGEASRALDGLRRIATLGEVRYSPMLYAPLQSLFLWDFHVVASLERWRAAHGPRAGGWLDALGEAEALAALSTLAHDNPSWSVPVVDPAAPTIAGEAVGHPLLPDAVRVSNDIAVGPAGTFVLVTGSNMSGKSTLLRSVGTNAVLAMAGGPVCAGRLHLPMVDVRTSIRVQDSLEAGVSLFLAELRRVKQVVDAARTAAAGRPVLFLLDEILHGTNTAERRVAARAVVRHLLRHGATGLVTTHDLAIADDPEIAAAARQVHFSERIAPDAGGGTTMTFDYVLQPGPATSANALRLLAAMGLGEDLPVPPTRLVMPEHGGAPGV